MAKIREQNELKRVRHTRSLLVGNTTNDIDLHVAMK